MNQEPEQDVDTETVKEASRKAAGQSESIREEVRNITLQALSQGRLDVDKIKHVAHAVIEGASIGAKEKGVHVKATLSESIAGLDDALEQVAEASKLSLEEAAGHLKEFSRRDLKQAQDDLLALEGIYLDILKSVAKSSDEVISNTLNDLIQHVRNSGTAVGKRSAKIVEALNHELRQTISETVTASADTALKVASKLSHAAAGFLDGIAQTLDSKVKTRTPDKQE